MRLFTIGNDFQVELNKEWLMLIPEFAELLKRDKGSKGDYRGDKKAKAKKELSFIFFDLDFTSPIREWDDLDRRKEALQYAGLAEADLDEEVIAAHRKYNELLEQSSRSLKTLRAVEKSLDAMDHYFASINFSDKDKKGELVHNPNSYLSNIEKLGKAYDALDKFKKRVEDELKGDASIRGSATLGQKEGKRDNWNELPELPAESSIPVAKTSFADIAKMLHNTDEYVNSDKEDE